MQVDNFLINQSAVELIALCIQKRNELERFSEEYDILDNIITHYFEHKSVEKLRSEMLDNSHLFL